MQMWCLGRPARAGGRPGCQQGRMRAGDDADMHHCCLKKQRPGRRRHGAPASAQAPWTSQGGCKQKYHGQDRRPMRNEPYHRRDGPLLVASHAQVLLLPRTALALWALTAAQHNDASLARRRLQRLIVHAADVLHDVEHEARLRRQARRQARAPTTRSGRCDVGPHRHPHAPSTHHHEVPWTLRPARFPCTLRDSEAPCTVRPARSDARRKTAKRHRLQCAPACTSGRRACRRGSRR